MWYSSLNILFKVLKSIRLQEVGTSAPQKYLLAAACVAVANQHDKNILRKPLFMKSLSKAAYIAQNYSEYCLINGGNDQDLI